MNICILDSNAFNVFINENPGCKTSKLITINIVYYTVYIHRIIKYVYINFFFN